MKDNKKNLVYFGLGFATLLLAVMAILIALRLRQLGPVAPTVPQAEPQAIEGSPVPACQFVLNITLPSPTPSPSATPTPLPSISPSPTPLPSPTPSPTPLLTPSPSPTPLPTPSVTPTPLPTPTPGAQCLALKFYEVNGDINDPINWRLLTHAELTALQPGATIYISTIGTYSGGGVIDKARIRVNSAVWLPEHETTLIKPGSSPQEFYISYTIPGDGTTTFTFGAEVHEATQDKWY